MHRLGTRVTLVDMKDRSAEAVRVSEGTAKIACVVMQAGPEVALALEHRLGRAPVRLLGTDPLAWRCADGQVEHIAFAGSQALKDHERVVSEIAGRGLLIAEIPEGANLEQAGLEGCEPSWWLLDANGTVQESH